MKLSTLLLQLLLFSWSHVSDSYTQIHTSTRRAWLKFSQYALVGTVAGENAFAAPTTTKFTDPTHGFAIDIPADWSSSEQTLADRRRILLWSDPADARSSFFIAYTPVRDDFTSLGSFGSVDQVAAQTILPKGELAGTQVKAEMLSATSAKQAYIFDYTQEVPKVQPATHFRTIFTLQQGATGGAGAVLVTLTAQCAEEKYETNKALFDSIISSYGKS